MRTGIVLLLVAAAAAASEWRDDIEAAVAEGRKTGTPVLVYVLDGL